MNLIEYKKWFQTELPPLRIIFLLVLSTPGVVLQSVGMYFTQKLPFYSSRDASGSLAEKPALTSDVLKPILKKLKLYFRVVYLYNFLFVFFLEFIFSDGLFVQF